MKLFNVVKFDKSDNYTQLTVGNRNVDDCSSSGFTNVSRLNCSAKGWNPTHD